MANTAEKLDEKSVSEYWNSVSEPLAKLFELMREREYWIDTSDDAVEAVASIVETLVTRFEDDGFVEALDEADKAVMMAQMLSLADMPLFVRTLVLLDQKKAGVVPRLAHAMARISGESEIFAHLYFERMQVVLQAGLRGQIFSAQRIKQLTQTLTLIKEGGL